MPIAEYKIKKALDQIALKRASVCLKDTTTIVWSVETRGSNVRGRFQH